MTPEPADPLEELLRAARATRPDTSKVEFAFETRLMARLREHRGATLSSWAWKLAPFFAVVVVALGVWNRASAAHLESTASLVAEAVREHPDRLLMSLVARAAE
jgi:hypothetical protein